MCFGLRLITESVESFESEKYSVFLICYWGLVNNQTDKLIRILFLLLARRVSLVIELRGA